MKKRMIITLIAVAVLLTALGFVKYNQIQTAIAQGASYTPPPEAVTTIVAAQDQWQITLGAIGTVTAVQGSSSAPTCPASRTRLSSIPASASAPAESCAA
jgi:membrane fusion protein (multidrug efflux system)